MAEITHDRLKSAADIVSLLVEIKELLEKMQPPGLELRCAICGNPESKCICKEDTRG